MPLMKSGSIVDPVDAQVGGDADIGGISQTITSDDIAPLINQIDAAIALLSMRA